ncbi:MAG: tripartite tricarboxylate transporter substrate binding protein BugD [Betaproteobacteria bacterium]|nr:tripartite tricarboxylate transporter substrate binding protein BugD [Betaproteobacteria bacterium]
MKTCKVLFQLLVIAAALQSPVYAQGRPIRFVVPYAAGGAVDVYARAVAVPFGRHLNQPVVIENVGGAGGNIAVARVAKSNPDGETLLYHNMAMATNPSLYRKLDYDPLSDFDFVGVAAHSIMAMVTRRDLPVSDLKQFIPYARANGDKITIGDGGIGGPTNLCALLFMSAIGTKFTIISYKGGAPALNDVMGSQIDLLCDGTATTARHIAAGKIKTLGVSSKARLPSMPNVPTIAEGGLPGFELSPWSAIYAPKGTPRPVIQRLEGALQAATGDRDLAAHFDNLGLVLASRDMATSAGLAAHLKTEIEKWGGILRKAGVPQLD